MFVARSESYRHSLQTTHSPKVAVSGAQPRGSRDFQAGAWDPAGRAPASSSADRSLGRDMTGRYVIGIDGGTEGLRAAVVDLDGTVLDGGERLRDALPAPGVGRAGSGGLVARGGDRGARCGGAGGRATG